MAVHAPRTSAEPLRVFVGTSAGGDDAEACAALEGSLRRRTSVPVEVAWLRPSPDPASPCGGWRSERWSSPWTALRWAVPEMCAWRGRAVYLDCASLVLADVAELAAAEIPQGAFVLACREGRELLTGCLVFDCAAARRWLPALPEMRADVGSHQAVGALLDRRRALVDALPRGWGWSDKTYARERGAGACSVHFTALATQPHGPRAVARLAREGRSHWFEEIRLPHYYAPLVALWEEEAAAAAGEGFTPERYLPARERARG